jgi:CO/xanthine dehydrogenase Mo-binding subunit
MPVASDLPMIDNVLLEIPNPKHPQGVRGVGEVPLVASVPAVANAVNNALGLDITSLPMSPPKIQKAVKSKAKSAA